MSISSRTRAEVNQLYTEAQEVMPEVEDFIEISSDEEVQQPAQHPQDFIEISSDEEVQQPHAQVLVILLF